MTQSSRADCNTAFNKEAYWIGAMRLQQCSYGLGISQHQNSKNKSFILGGDFSRSRSVCEVTYEEKELC